MLAETYFSNCWGNIGEKKNILKNHKIITTNQFVQDVTMSVFWCALSIDAVQITTFGIVETKTGKSADTM